MKSNFSNLSNNEKMILLLTGIIILFALVAGIQLCRGKWLNLMAGYNTMSREEKSKLNGKFLGRVIGSLLIFCVAVVVVTVFWPKFANAAVVVLTIAVIVALIYMNTSKKRLK